MRILIYVVDKATNTLYSTGKVYQNLYFALASAKALANASSIVEVRDESRKYSDPLRTLVVYRNCELILDLTSLADRPAQPRTLAPYTISEFEPRRVPGSAKVRARRRLPNRGVIHLAPPQALAGPVSTANAN